MVDGYGTCGDAETETYLAYRWLDMNGDGSPEIVVHSRTSDAYADTVYTLDNRTGIVRAVAETSSGYA